VQHDSARELLVDRLLAHRWRRKFESGRAKSIADLAEQQGVTDAYVCRFLPLTCLAPDVVEAILDGRQPKGLRLADMLGLGRWVGGAAAPLADLTVDIRQVSGRCATRRSAQSETLPSELAIGLPACSSTPSQRSLPMLSRTGLTKVVFISTVVKACPGSRVECTAQFMAVSRRNASQPPLTNPWIVEAGGGRRLECHVADLDRDRPDPATSLKGGAGWKAVLDLESGDRGRAPAQGDEDLLRRERQSPSLDPRS
jgi:hypothetical protein